MNKMMFCPKCRSTDIKRLIFEWNFKELLLILLCIVLVSTRLVRHSYDDFLTFKIGIVIGVVGLIIFPILLNLRFPRYKCKSCGKKFKPNGEDAEDVFDDY